MKEKLINVGKYDRIFNEILGLNLDELEIYRSSGLVSHMLKRRHYKALKYIDNIEDVISNPDYVGINPNEKGISLEYIKRFEDNVLLGVKLDSSGKYLYVSTIHDLEENKITRRLNSKRIFKV